jgi:hypothetical protein
MTGEDVVSGTARTLAAFAGRWPPAGERWHATALSVRTDAALGGRWTSLRTADREWLWRHRAPDVARARLRVRPGSEFVDAGGVEECFPTVRGEPDHGDAWSRPWHEAGGGTDGGEHVEVAALRLTRRFTADECGVRVAYTVSGPPGARFVHAVHALLDVGPNARLVVPAAHRVHLLDTPHEGATTTTSWPPTVAGRPLDHLGPDDGTAVAALLPDCRAAVVVDGGEALALTWRATTPADDEMCSLLIWRNLGGWPEGAPYRSIGVEPMVGRTATLCPPHGRPAPGEPARLGASGRFGWELSVSAARRG